ncbi:ABC transporter ATP-binding protein [Alteromonas sp. a30]|uniref:ABC transporter ATP-binding protein n=1 Tax=Alteromonas sp. a30 TaxID=2730917 RepID=UPI00228315F0|nr:ABC transporter ATP-binding protein [Alteromonas sp. a30]MCY7295840.1 ABC transporter ATP-binding protein [Alteromonas sp. a30]
MLRLDNVTLQLSDNTFIDDLSFNVNSGVMVSLLGEDIASKQAIIEAISGFSSINSGQIIIEGQVVAAQGNQVKPHQRGMGVVFSDLALFPHLTVEQNIAFGLSTNNAKDKTRKIADILTELMLDAHKLSHINALSAEQKVLVAFARALATEPSVVLLEDIFSRVNANERLKLIQKIRNVLKSGNIAAVLATQDPQDAFAFSDVMGVIQHRRLLQWDEPATLYEQPKTQAIAALLGICSFIKAKVQINEDHCELLTELGVLTTHLQPNLFNGQIVEILIRPFDINIKRLISSDEGRDPQELTAKIGKIINRIYNGSVIQYEVELAVSRSIVTLYSHLKYNFSQGDVIEMGLCIKKPKVFPL